MHLLGPEEDGEDGCVGGEAEEEHGGEVEAGDQVHPGGQGRALGQVQEQVQGQVQGHPTQPRHEVQGPRAALTSKVSW